MEASKPENIINKLSSSLNEIMDALEGVDLEIRAYPDGDWRIREILLHLATWDQQVTKSIGAFSEGSEYAISDLKLNSFNQEEIDKLSSLSNEQVIEYWEQARQDFKDAVQAVPSEIFSEEMLYPWGDERGTVSLIVKYMCAHDDEHKEDIVKAAKESTSN